MIGALLGLGTQMYSNALRKLPYMRRKFPFIAQFVSYSLIHPDKQIDKLIDVRFRSVGARAGDGTWGRVRESARQMGRSALGGPRQDARQSQGRQRAPLLRYSFFSISVVFALFDSFHLGQSLLQTNACFI